MPDLAQKLAATWPHSAWQDMGVVIAVSGGPDSVALLHAMCTLKTSGDGQLTVAHLNHGLRCQDSDADEAFVATLAHERQLPFESGRTDVTALAQSQGDGWESAARTARYGFLQSTAEKVGARYVVTAHTADDQAETIMHRILRGTGLAGLSGMPRARRLGPCTTLIRPLLEVQRSDIMVYLDSVGQTYREDQTNRDVRFTRNAIRHDLLPKIRAEYNPHVTEALLRLGQLASEAQSVIDALTDDLRERAVERTDHQQIMLRLTPLESEPRYLVRELLRRVWNEQAWRCQSMGFAEWEQLSGMMDGANGRHCQTLPGGIKAERRDERLILRRHG